MVCICIAVWAPTSVFLSDVARPDFLDRLGVLECAAYPGALISGDDRVLPRVVDGTACKQFIYMYTYVLVVGSLVGLVSVSLSLSLSLSRSLCWWVGGLVGGWVCVCVWVGGAYMRIYIYIYIHINTNMCVHLYIFISMYICFCTYICVRTHMYVYV